MHKQTNEEKCIDIVLFVVQLAVTLYYFIYIYFLCMCSYGYTPPLRSPNRLRSLKSSIGYKSIMQDIIHIGHNIYIIQIHKISQCEHFCLLCVNLQGDASLSVALGRNQQMDERPSSSKRKKTNLYFENRISSLPV